MTTPPVSLLADDCHDPGRRLALEAHADRLRRLGRTLGTALLRGRHIAIAGSDRDAPSARLVERAATALGARVSHLRYALLAPSGRPDEAAARVLGTLYDAIEGVAMPERQAREFQRLAGIPVFPDLAGPASPLRALMHAPGDDEELVALVMAALIEALA